MPTTTNVEFSDIAGTYNYVSLVAQLVINSVADSTVKKCSLLKALCSGNRHLLKPSFMYISHNLLIIDILILCTQPLC